jgi:hypothetical protein
MKQVLLYGMFVVASLILINRVDAQGQNLLQDPGFESVDYRLVSTDPNDPFTTFNVPVGWWGGVVQPPGPEPWRNVHPTGFPHTAGLKIEGGRSFHMARGGGTFTAYLYQQVSVAPGTDVEGGAWAYMENNGGGLMRVGIDPTGGTNPFTGTVIWSPWSGTRYQWTQLSVRARVESGVATLFLFATQDAPSNPNGVYWDQAFLYGVPGHAALPVITDPGAPSVAPAVPAPSIPSYVTATVRLRVRNGPGTNFAQIGSINRGASYPVVEEASGWYGIDFNGQRGFVSGEFVTVGSGALPPQIGQPTVTLDFTVGYTLRLRSAPTTESETLARIPYTTIIQAIGRTADNRWLLDMLIRPGG